MEDNISSNENESSSEEDDNIDEKLAEEMQEDNDEIDRRYTLQGLPSETCLQDETTEGDDIYSVAPAEGNKHIPLLTDEFFEELANPDKFPLGRGGFSTKRIVNLSASKYVKTRLLDQDGRFSKDPEYLLAMQYAVEHKQVNDSISIALRQTKGQFQGEDLRAGLLKDPSRLAQLVKQDKAYKFLKNIRGSPAYWQKMFYETLAMIRQLGIPTWFLTLSGADMKWPEVISSIASQYGQIYSDEEVSALPWETKSKWLRNNPVTAARMFQYRLETFWKDFLKSKSNPLGIVTDYVIRIEFQARGSPHAHTLIWIKDSPKLGYADDKDVISFIDQYISAGIPENDDYLKELV